MKLTSAQLRKLIREFYMGGDRSLGGTFPPVDHGDSSGGDVGYIKIYKNENGNLLQKFYGGTTKASMIEALDRAIPYFMSLIMQARDLGLDIDRDDPGDTMGPITDEELSKQMTILYYSAYPPYDPLNPNEIREPLLQYILNVEPYEIYGVDMYDHVWNNYPGLQARHPGDEI
tara:strand:+ start:2889 stop:3407 length:519 start_codon:yes stop_codon:yes gene_type:complete